MGHFTLISRVLLCLLITTLVGLEPAPPGVCQSRRRFPQLERYGRYFGARCQYYANTSAIFQSCRLRLSGDIEPNPGPAAARSISVISQNVRSIRNKLHTLRTTAPDLSRHDVISLTVTWLTPDLADSELQHGLDHHTWFRRDRPTHGGGVACAVRTHLCPTRRADLETDCEVLVVQLGTTLTSFVVVCYRPPDRDRDVALLLDAISKVRSTGRPLIVTGDWNLPEITWSRGRDPVLSRRTQRALQFLDGIDSHDSQQSVYSPTRGDVILDLVLSSGGDVVTSVQTGTFESDHSETVSRFLICAPAIPTVTRTQAFNYRRADFDGLRAALRYLPWNLLSDLDVDSATELFYDLINAAIVDHVPTVTRRCKFPPWFDAAVRHALRAKEAAHRLKKSCTHTRTLRRLLSCSVRL